MGMPSDSSSDLDIPKQRSAHENAFVIPVNDVSEDKHAAKRPGYKRYDFRRMSRKAMKNSLSKTGDDGVTIMAGRSAFSSTKGLLRSVISG